MRGVDADKRAKFGPFIMMCVATKALQTHGLSCAAASSSCRASSSFLESTAALYNFGNIFTREQKLKYSISFPGNLFLFSVSKSKLNTGKLLI